MYNIYKDLVINATADYPVVITDAAGAVVADASNATTGSKMSIYGFGNFNYGEVISVSGQRGVNPVNYSQTFNAASFTFVAPAIRSTVYFRFSIRSIAYEAEYSQYQMSFEDNDIYAIEVLPTDTATSVMRKLVRAIYDRKTRFNDEQGFTLSFVGATPELATAFTVTAVSPRLTWDFEATDEFLQTYSTIITAITPTTTVRRFEGFGTDRYVRENIRLLTYPSTRPYGIKQDQLAVNGNLYTAITFKIRVANSYQGNSVLGQVNTSESTYVIFINEAIPSGVNDPLYKIAYFTNNAVTANGGTPLFKGATIEDSNNPKESRIDNANVAIAAFVA